MQIREEKKEEHVLRPGYDLKWVVEKSRVITNGLECGWCNGIVRNHRELACCDILACLGCLVKHKKCPSCKKEILNPFGLSHSKRFQRTIDNMMVVCPFEKEGEPSCPWGKTVENPKTLKDTDAHAMECRFFPVECEICSEMFPRSEKEKHNKESMENHVVSLTQTVKNLKKELKDKVLEIQQKEEKEALEQKEKEEMEKRKEALQIVKKELCWWNGMKKDWPVLGISLMQWKKKPEGIKPLINPPGHRIATKEEVLKRIRDKGLQPYGKNLTWRGYWAPEFINNLNFLFKDTDCICSGSHFPYLTSTLYPEAGYVCIIEEPEKIDSKSIMKKFNITDEDVKNA